MKLSAKTLADDIKNVKLSAALEQFYNECVVDVLEFYGEDEDCTGLVDDYIKKANEYLAKNEPKSEPKKEEPKAKSEPKAEPKKEEPKTKKTSKKKAPTAMFKVGAWVIDNATEQAGIISERLNYDDERGWLYHVEYVGSNRQSLVKESDLSRTRAPRVVAKTGEIVPELSAEIKIISRYIKLHDKKYGKIANDARLTLTALQKMIINKQIRKTSKYAKEINAIQDSLVKLVNGKYGDSEVVEIAHIDELRKIVTKQNVSELSDISRSFVSLIGKDNKKKEAKSLYEKIMKHAFKGNDSDEASTMKKALKAYINDETETVYATARELQGIFGLAGIL